MRTVLLASTLLCGWALASADDAVIPTLNASELRQVVAPVALYPDDLVAVVLPAAAHPLQIVQAQRRIENGEAPAANWDEAVVALMNYPEVVDFLNADLDWTETLGLAFVNQEAGVFNAIQDFRNQALAAGNLKSDQYQTVSVERGIITIRSRADDSLYVPYYEPEKVVVRYVQPVYHYYPVARPVYYYPYPASYRFGVNHFYGVGTYFSIGWQYRGLSLHYAGGSGHPYPAYRYSVRYSPKHYHYRPARRHYVVGHRHHYRPKAVHYKQRFRPNYRPHVKHRHYNSSRHAYRHPAKAKPRHYPTNRYRAGYRDGGREAERRTDRRAERRQEARREGRSQRSYGGMQRTQRPDARQSRRNADRPPRQARNEGRSQRSYGNMRRVEPAGGRQQRRDSQRFAGGNRQR